VGTSTTAAEFNGKIGRWVDNVKKLPATQERRNARTAETALRAAVASMSGGDMRLSRAGGGVGRGASVGVSTTTVGGGKVVVSAKGPVALVENPTMPHEIGSDGDRLKIGTGWATGPVRHPGTRGKREWRRTREDVLPPLILADTHKSMGDTARAVF
jgi:hypothetical protein